MNKSKFPTILGIVVLVIGVVAGVYLIGGRKMFKLGASGEVAPKDVRITNITDVSFTVSWTTDRETSGFVLWGESLSQLDKTKSDEIQDEGNTHTTTIRGLKPASTYYLKINSGGYEFDNNGIPWQLQSGAQLPPPASSNTISGSVVTVSGTPASKALVYVSIGGASPLSAITSDSGSWVIPLGTARVTNLDSYYPIDEDNNIVEIFVQMNPSEVASAQIYPFSAKPAPPIIIGQTHDFKNLPASISGESPDAALELPEETTRSSNFDVPENIEATPPEVVTLESLDEGEVVTSTKPEFFGNGPPGTDLTITVESEAILGSAKIGSSGWSWSPPQNLEEGIHKITLSWRDENGILRTLTRTFIVQAAENPAFESTPSATNTPAPTSTPTQAPSVTTPAPTATVTSYPTSTASATPVSSIIPTTQPIPDSGTLTPTLILSIMGLGLLATSGYVAYLADKK